MLQTASSIHPPSTNPSKPSQNLRQLRIMALPPEQINIKRRREEEPVETLCTNPPVFFPRNVDPSQKIHDTIKVVAPRDENSTDN
jgi:hypothetical protein